MDSGDSGAQAAELIRGRYEPLEVLGRGGEGEVVRALDHLHQRTVALKIRNAASAQDREQLLWEARILLDLKPHPALPLVREDFFVADRYFLVMDWVEGTSLQKVLEDRGDPGLPHSVVVTYLAQVAQALDHLHGHRPPVIHGDVKPANLILTTEGRVVLVDFGISRQQGRQGGRAMGSRGYAAPEVAAGIDLTPASDVYSLGATAFTLLVGRPPDGLTPAWEGIPPAAAQAVERAIRRALSIEPSRRPGSTVEFVERLRAWLESELPAGTVTFLMAEIEEAAGLWERNPGVMGEALARYDALVSETVERHSGRLAGAPGGRGATVAAAFSRPSMALACALDLQQALLHVPWALGAPLRVGMALHTGEADLRDGHYVGPALSRCARLRAMARGGAVLISAPTADLVWDALPEATALEDFGRLTPEGTKHPEKVFRLSHPDLPEVLPVAPSPSSDTLPLERLNQETDARAVAPPARRSDRGRRRQRRALLVGIASLGLAAAVLVSSVVLRGAPRGGIRSPDESERVGGVGLPSNTVRLDPASIVVIASSEHPLDDAAGGITYFARNTIDADRQTAWNDGAERSGIGESLTYRFAEPVELVGIDALNGYVKTLQRFVENARMREARVTTDTGSYPMSFRDSPEWQRFRQDFGTTSSVTLEVLSVYPGSRFPEVAITEVVFWVHAPRAP